MRLVILFFILYRGERLKLVEWIAHICLGEIIEFLLEIDFSWNISEQHCYCINFYWKSIFVKWVIKYMYIAARAKYSCSYSTRTRALRARARTMLEPNKHWPLVLVLAGRDSSCSRAVLVTRSPLVYTQE